MAAYNPPTDEKRAPLDDAESFTNTSGGFHDHATESDIAKSRDGKDLAGLLHDNLNIQDAPPAYHTSREGPGSASSYLTGRPSSERSAPTSSPGTRGLYTAPPGAPQWAPHNASFPPLVLYSQGSRLEDGFYVAPPPSNVEPHPFAQRNVREPDWTKFLNDIQTSARSAVHESRSPLPRPMSRGIIGNVILSLSASAIEKQRESGSRNSLGPGALVDMWNEDFFHPRGLDVVLAKGSHRLNGNLSLPPPDFYPGGQFNGNMASRSSPSMPPPMPSPGYDPRSRDLPSSGQDMRGRELRAAYADHAYFDSAPAPAHWQPEPGYQHDRNNMRRSRSVSSSSSSSSSSSCSSSGGSKKNKKDGEKDRKHRSQEPQAQFYPNPNVAAGPSSSGSRGLDFTGNGVGMTSNTPSPHALRKMQRAERRSLRAARKEQKRGGSRIENLLDMGMEMGMGRGRGLGGGMGMGMDRGMGGRMDMGIGGGLSDRMAMGGRMGMSGGLGGRMGMGGRLDGRMGMGGGLGGMGGGLGTRMEMGMGRRQGLVGMGIGLIRDMATSSSSSGSSGAQEEDEYYRLIVVNITARA